MDIEYIPHATNKIKRRDLSPALIEQTLQNPNQRIEADKGRKIAQSKIERAGTEYLLRIIYEETPGKLLVITAYLTNKIEKYWSAEEQP